MARARWALRGAAAGGSCCRHYTVFVLRIQAYRAEGWYSAVQPLLLASRIHMTVHWNPDPDSLGPWKSTRVQGITAVHRRTNGTTGASATTNARSDVGGRGGKGSLSVTTLG